MNRIDPRQRLPAEPRIVALGGGGGGVGRSTIATELARLAARKGRRTLVVDADVANPSAHRRFELSADHLKAGAFVEAAPVAPLIIGGDRQRPAVLPLGLCLPRPFSRAEFRAGPFVRQLRSLEFDLVVVDLPATPDPVWSSIFALSDVPIVVAATEGGSLLAATRYVRHAIVFALLNQRAAADIERELLRAIDGLALDWRVDALRTALPSKTRPLLDDVLDRFELYLLLSHTRETSERELGSVISLAWSHLLDVRPRYLGSVDHDERRWFHLRQSDTVPGLNSDDGTDVQCEAIARRLVELDDFDATQTVVRRSREEGPCDLLGVPADVEPLAVRQRYRRLWEGFRRDSPVHRVLVPADDRRVLLEELEEANRQVQVWLKERPASVEAPPPRAPDRPQRNPGEAIARTRQERDLSQRELSLQTKIGLRYLVAIEAFDVEALPRPVYLRGYLREIARALSLEPEPLLDDYLTTLSEARTDRVLSRDS